MRPTDEDALLKRALRLARRGRYTASPNPVVGAVVTNSRGRVIGEGHHRAPGEPHAEIVALDDAGSEARGGTLYLTLEPCVHHGRTPPCVDSILERGVRRVVACHADPDPRVAGGGFRALQQGGVVVSWGHLVRQAAAANLRFLVSKVLGRPLVTLKWAMSLDGKIATAQGESQWISSPRGRQWALALREEHDAVLVGSGTVLADDPSLDRRLGFAGRPNVRVVLDRRLRVSAEARLFAVPGQVVIYTESADQGMIDPLRATGATVVSRRPLTPAKVLSDLYRRGVESVLVEGGSDVLGLFRAGDLFDRVEVCCAPMLIGGREAPGPVGGPGEAALAASPRLEVVRVGRRSPDVIFSAVRAGRIEQLAAGLAPARAISADGRRPPR